MICLGYAEVSVVSTPTNDDLCGEDIENKKASEINSVFILNDVSVGVAFCVGSLPSRSPIQTAGKIVHGNADDTTQLVNEAA